MVNIHIFLCIYFFDAIIELLFFRLKMGNKIMKMGKEQYK